MTISVEALHSVLRRSATTNAAGEFRLDPLPPDEYRITFKSPGGRALVYPSVVIPVGSRPSLTVVLKPQGGKQSIQVLETAPSQG